MRENKHLSVRYTVYKKLLLRKNFSFSSGQALTELVICLVAICVVLLAVILFSVAGVQGVKNVIEARENADTNYANKRRVTNSRQISYWENIDGLNGDGMQFTSDDTPISGAGASGSLFKDELVTSDGNLNVISIASKSNEAHYDAFDLAVVRVFLNAAQLTSGSAQIDDVLDNKYLYDTKHAIKRFGVAGKITIKDSVYMPVIYESK